MRRAFAGVPGAFLLAAVCSCRTVEYVPVERLKTDTVRTETVRRDSVAVHDSVWIRERGDTVTIYRIRYKYVDRVRRDTAYVVRTNTVTRTVTREAGKPVPWWRRLLSWTGGLALVLAALAAASQAKGKWK